MGDFSIEFRGQVDLKFYVDRVRTLAVTIYNRSLAFSHFEKFTQRKLEDFHGYLEWLQEDFQGRIKEAREDPLKWWLDRKGITTTGITGVTPPNEMLFEYLMFGHKYYLTMPENKLRNNHPVTILEIHHPSLHISFLVHIPTMEIDWILLPCSFGTGYRGLGARGYEKIHRIINEHKQYFPILLKQISAPYNKQEGGDKSCIEDYLWSPNIMEQDIEFTLQNFMATLHQRDFSENPNVEFKRKVPGVPFPIEFKQEFLKDCIALANAYRGDFSRSYLIIGFSEEGARWDYGIFAVQNIDNLIQHMGQLISEYITPRLFYEFHDVSITEIITSTRALSPYLDKNAIIVNGDGQGKCLILELQREPNSIYEIKTQIGNFRVGMSWYRIETHAFDMTEEIRCRLKRR